MAVWVGCGDEKEVLLSGNTMGTTYHVTLAAGSPRNTGDLGKKIDARLDEISQSMSTYIKGSEISRFNAIGNTREKFYISDDFFYVMIVARKLYDLTEGTWDGSIDPLINLWGFGRSEMKTRVPSENEILTILANTGFDHVEISPEKKYLKKKKASLSLDLASVAKGYGVDQVAKLIRESGCKNFLVEIGGEIYASGLRMDGNPWRIGINTPLKKAARNDVYKLVLLRDKAFATSGDYRIFFESGGSRYSHILDPTTGYPVSNGVVSVSVVADNCTFADGLATALVVMGHEKGLELLNSLQGIEGLIIVRDGNGKLRDYNSEGFDAQTR